MGAKAHSPLAVRERLLLGAYVGRSADMEADDHREECLTGNITDCGTRIGGTDDLAVLLCAASACVTVVYDRSCTTHAFGTGMLTAFHLVGCFGTRQPVGGLRGYGAAGSASAWHAEGQGFESP
jgi:hypothetical protein